MSDQNLCEGLLKSHPYHQETAFAEMLRLQRLFSSRFTPYEELDNGELRLHWTREYIVCIMDEVQEVIGWLPWKHWKHYPENFELKLEELRFELVDILHFFMDLGFVLDFEWQSTGNICQTVDKLTSKKGHEAYDLQAQTEATKSWACQMYKFLGDIDVSASMNNWARARDHFANLFITFVDGLVLWDMDGETLNNFYRSKNAENIDRQNRGY